MKRVHLGKTASALLKYLTPFPTKILSLFIAKTPECNLLIPNLTTDFSHAAFCIAVLHLGITLEGNQLGD